MAEIMVSLMLSQPFPRQQTQSKMGGQSATDITDGEFDTLLDAHKELQRIRIADAVHTMLRVCRRNKTEHLVILTNVQNEPIEAGSFNKTVSALLSTIDVEVVPITGSSPLEVAQEVVRTIDSFAKTDRICACMPLMQDIRSVGFLYGCFARADRVAEIMYPEPASDAFEIVPLMRLKLTRNQKKVLHHFLLNEKSVKKHHHALKMDKSSFYFILRSLRDRGFLEKDMRITSLGRVALL